MDQKLKGYVARNAENKRRSDNNPKYNHVQQPPFKRKNVERAYTVGNNNKKGYAGILPLCDKLTCYGCGGKGHTKRYCPELGNANGDEEARQNLDIVMGTSLPEKFVTLSS
ncbi:reverse transcriptase domain-containing protein [Tanacetum coccineum]